jgi:GAF domain-containing protein
MTREEWLATRTQESGTPDHAAKSAPSQLVVPLRHANRTLGALSVQTKQFNAYTRQHVELMENVASQLSVAIVNSQLLEQTRQAVDELNALNRRLTGEAWQNYAQLRSPTAVIWYANDPTLSQVGRAQAEQLAAGTIAVQQAANEADVPPKDGDCLISVPIMLRGQLIGALRFRAPTDKWTDEAQAIATSLAGHVAQAAENTRLIEQTQQTAQREKQIAQAADKIHRASTLDAILQTAVAEIARITGAEDVGIQLSAPSTPASTHGNGQHPTR